jgi:starch phosphorylase
VRVLAVESSASSEIKVNDPMTVRAQVHLAGMTADNVAVELYQGSVDAGGELQRELIVEMEPVEAVGDDHWFEATKVSFGKSGLHGLTVRVLPRHPDLVNPHRMGLIAWG